MTDVMFVAGAPEEDPWASKTSVLAALQEAGPMRAKRPHAEHDADDPMRGMALGGDDEDPLRSTGAERKAKKAKKEKKEKKEKDKDKKKKQVLAHLYKGFLSCQSIAGVHVLRALAWCYVVPAMMAVGMSVPSSPHDPYVCWLP